MGRLPFERCLHARIPGAVTIILVVFIGGSVAGVLGMLLAIPAAACIKIFFEEVVLPPLRRWAATH